MKMNAVEKRFVNSTENARRVAQGTLELLERIPVESGMRYLEVGCGVGSAPLAVAQQKDLEVVGVDIDPEQIAVANSRAGSNVSFLTMDATQLTFDNASFDIVATHMATHHIAAWEGAVAEMIRVLRPGGYLLYVDFALPGWLANTAKAVYPHLGYPSLGSLDAIAARHDLEKIYRVRTLFRVKAIYHKLRVLSEG